MTNKKFELTMEGRLYMKIGLPEGILMEALKEKGFKLGDSIKPKEAKKIYDEYFAKKIENLSQEDKDFIRGEKQQ